MKVGNHEKEMYKLWS